MKLLILKIWNIKIIWEIRRFCYWYLNPRWWIQPYFLSFVEEAVLNPKYEGYIGGRLELWSQWSQYDIDEFRFFTKNTEEFYKFRDKYDFEDVSWFTLQRVKKELEEKFHDKVK